MLYTISWAVVVCGLIAAAVNIAWAASNRRSPKSGLRVFTGLVLVYVSAVYTLSIAGAVRLPDQGPYLVRPVIALLLLLLAYEPIADWRRPIR